MENINANLKDLINELEKKSPQKYLVFIERIADSAQIIGEILSEQKLMKGILLAQRASKFGRIELRNILNPHDTKQKTYL